MNGVPEFYEVKMKQTSKGIWYCDGIVASTEHMIDTVAQVDLTIDKIEKMLKKHNEEAEK